MASIPPRSRWKKPQKTACFTDSKTFRQFVWKINATSCQATLRPAGKEPTVAGRQVALSSGPRHSLHRHAALWAVHTPPGIDKMHGDPPQRHELPPPLRQPVVARPAAAAARADRPAILAGMNLHFERRPPRAFHPFGFSVNKGLERFDPIEDSIQLHPVVAPGEMVGFATPSLTGNATGCTYFPTADSRYTVSVWRNGAGLCWRATRQGIARPGRVNDPQPRRLLSLGLFSTLSFICPVLPQKNARRNCQSPYFLPINSVVEPEI